MSWLLGILFILGSMATLAWYGGNEHKPTRAEKWVYGLLAIACWLGLLILVNLTL
jgi:hypothetical protein